MFFIDEILKYTHVQISIFILHNEMSLSYTILYLNSGNQGSGKHTLSSPFVLRIKQIISREIEEAATMSSQVTSLELQQSSCCQLLRSLTESPLRVLDLLLHQVGNVASDCDHLEPSNVGITKLFRLRATRNHWVFLQWKLIQFFPFYALEFHLW